MLFNFFKKEKKFPTKRFVIVAFSSIIILFFVMALLSFLAIKHDDKFKINKSSKGFYYLKDVRSKDPLVVNNPKLYDMLAGPMVREMDQKIGSDDAVVNIVYFADFACPYCKSQESTIKSVIDKYDGKVRFVWKDYPGGDTKSMSWKSSVAARCAGEQGKFWEYHNLLYNNQKDLSDELFLKLADILELRKMMFEECLDDKEIYGLVIDNIEEANALGVTGVPFMYVNDKGFLGGITDKELEQIIDFEINK